MALARITPGTALSTVGQCIGDLDRCARDVPNLSCGRLLHENLSKLRDMCADKILEIDLAICGDLSPPFLDAGVSWISAKLSGEQVARAVGTGECLVVNDLGDLKLRVWTWRARSPRIVKVGIPRPAIIVLLSENGEEARTNITSLAEEAYGDRPIAILIMSMPAGSELQLVSSLNKLAWSAESLNVNQLPECTLSAAL